MNVEEWLNRRVAPWITAQGITPSLIPIASAGNAKSIGKNKLGQPDQRHTCAPDLYCPYRSSSMRKTGYFGASRCMSSRVGASRPKYSWAARRGERVNARDSNVQTNSRPP
jgi:hypothetical protein